MGYYFENKDKRYITKGVKNEVPEHLIRLMWLWIDYIPPELREQYQYFSFKAVGSDNNPMQLMLDDIENPSSFICMTGNDSYYTGNVYVIDDGVASVMCLPHER